ncbi:MAG: hypothetical protein ACE5F2_01770 [Candidatus Paceibacteria bacterium]
MLMLLGFFIAWVVIIYFIIFFKVGTWSVILSLAGITTIIAFVMTIMYPEQYEIVNKVMFSGDTVFHELMFIFVGVMLSIASSFLGALVGVIGTFFVKKYKVRILSARI